MDQPSGKDSPIANQRIVGILIPETDITAVYKCLSTSGMRIEVVGTHHTLIGLHGKLKSVWLDELRIMKDGTNGPIASTTPETANDRLFDNDMC